MSISRTVRPADRCLIMVDSNDPRDYLELQYIPIEGFSYERNANIESRQVAGRNLETLHNTGGGKSLSLRLSFTPETANRTDMQRKVLWLESLTYNEGFQSPAPIVIVKLGYVIQEGRWVVASVRPSQSIFARDAVSGLTPSLAYVDIVFRRWAEYNVKRSDILYGTSFSDLGPDPSASYVGPSESPISVSGSPYVEASPSSLDVRTGEYIPRAEDDLVPNIDARKSWQRKTEREQYITNRQELINVGIELLKGLSVFSKSISK